MLMCTDGVLDANIEYKNKEFMAKISFRRHRDS